MRKARFLVIILFSLVSFQANAEIKVYEDTDNTGNNKVERIGIIEKYLIELSQNLKSMEVKIDVSNQKLKTLEENLALLKEKDIKTINMQLSEKSTEKKKDEKSLEELEKLKADMITIKNDDIEKMKIDLQALSFSMKQLEKRK